MTTIYNDQDFLAVYKQRKTIKNIFIGITAAVLAVCVAMLAYYMSLPYGDANQAIPKTVVYILTTAYILFLFPYMGIKYRRVNKYYKALSSFSQGLKLVERNYFYGFEEHSLQKDNIDVTYCIFESWNKKKQEWFDRAVYLDTEKPFPAFQHGDLVEYVVQSNFLLQYRILESGKMQFEKALTPEGELVVLPNEQDGKMD